MPKTRTPQEKEKDAKRQMELAQAIYNRLKWERERAITAGETGEKEQEKIIEFLEAQTPGTLYCLLGF